MTRKQIDVLFIRLKCAGANIYPFLFRALRVVRRRGPHPENAVAEISQVITNAHVRNLYFRPSHSHIREISRKLNIAYINDPSRP